MRQLHLGNTLVSDSSPAYVIAEIGHNHGGDCAVAQKMIRVAADCGAHAAKLQKRSNATLYSQALLDQPYENENSYGATYGAHREALELGLKEYAWCRDEAARNQVDFIATAFDESSADFLMHVGVAAIKIASGGLTDLALLRHVSSLGVPIILSTGGGTMREIDQAVQAVTASTNQLAILHCVAAYPVRDWSQHNLRCITTLREAYPETVIGWSGHDSGIALAMSAHTLGARIIEKHFTLNRANKGTDHAFSLEPSGLTKLCRDLSRAHAALGDGVKRYHVSEVGPISKMRRRETVQGPRITGEKDVPTVSRAISAP